MIEPERHPDAEPDAPEPDRRELAGSAMEIAAMALASAAGFCAPTDWNITLGLLVAAAALFAIGFFALTGTEA